MFIRNQTATLKMVIVATVVSFSLSSSVAIAEDDKTGSAWVDSVKQVWETFTSFLSGEDKASNEAHKNTVASTNRDVAGQKLFDHASKSDLVSCLLQLDAPSAGHAPLRIILDEELAFGLEHDKDEAPAAACPSPELSLTATTAAPIVNQLALASPTLDLGFPRPAGASALPALHSLQPFKVKEEFYELKNPGAAEGAGEGSIPSVKERQSQGTQKRIWITKFNVINVTEHPELGITQVALNELTDKSLQAKRSSEDIQKYGYLPQEMREIEDFFAQLIGQQANAQLSSKEIRRLVNIVNKQKELRGYTIGEIEQVADNVTQFYRSKGLLLATAYVPVQDITQGVVNIAVLEGNLGEVTINGNKRYTDKKLRQAFSGDVGNVVTVNSIEQSLYLLNDFPGLEVSGVFSPGKNIGDTMFNLNVNSEESWAGTFRMDNDGSEGTGEYRGFAVLEWYNPTKMGDTFRIGMLQTKTPDNATFGLIEYKTNIFTPKFYVSSFLNSSEYVVDIPSVNLAVGEAELTEDESKSITVQGSVVNAGVAIEYQFNRSRARNTRAKFEFTRKRNESRYTLEKLNVSALKSEGIFPGEEVVRAISLSLYKDRLFEKSRIVIQGDIGITYGESITIVGGAQDGEFGKIAFDTYSMAYFNPFNSDQAHRFLFRLHGQYSSKGLPAVEKMTLGGASAVRSFSVSDFSADNALLTVLEWVAPLPKALAKKSVGNQQWSDIFQFYSYVDAGYGAKEVDKNGAVLTQWAALSSVGVGIQYNFANRITGRLDVARTVTDKNSYDQIYDDKARSYFDMTFHF